MIKPSDFIQTHFCGRCGQYGNVWTLISPYGKIKYLCVSCFMILGIGRVFQDLREGERIWDRKKTIKQK